MFRSLTSLVLAFSLFGWFTHPASPPLRVAGSIVRITGEPNRVCTGFIVAPKLVLTAAHCLADGLRADGALVTLLKTDQYYDLALLGAPESHKGPISLRDAPVERFEELIALGYGNGWTELLMLRERVVMPAYAISSELPVGVIVQGGYVGGMSGGPVIDRDGKVVGIIQMNNGNIGYGVGTQFIKAFLYDAGRLSD